eukprot:7238756-Pyramimonas_sp.AAC.1
MAQSSSAPSRPCPASAASGRSSPRTSWTTLASFNGSPMKLRASNLTPSKCSRWTSGSAGTTR